MEIAFPFAANALRQAEAVTYPAPYVTPWTRTRREEWFAEQRGHIQEVVKERGAGGVAVLTPEDVQEIRRLYVRGGMRQHQIAAIVGCTQQNVSYHLRNLTHAA